MTNDNVKAVLQNDSAPDLRMSSSIPPDLRRGVVLQGAFGSDDARKEFMQTITKHGIEFLQISNSPLQQPINEDLSMIEELALALGKFWALKSNKRKQP